MIPCLPSQAQKIQNGFGNSLLKYIYKLAKYGF
jgi:hypothetical protein